MPAVAPVVTHRHRQARLAFCREYVDWNIQDCHAYFSLMNLDFVFLPTTDVRECGDRVANVFPTVQLLSTTVLAAPL